MTQQPAPSQLVSVMKGPLGDVDLASVIQVVSIGRQFTAVELRSEDGATMGTIFVKAGKIVGAVSRGVKGKEAFYRFFQPALERPAYFHVFRTRTPETLPEPLGPVGDLLIEAIDRAAQFPEGTPTSSHSVQAPEQPAPPVAAQAQAARPMSAPAAKSRPAEAPKPRVAEKPVPGPQVPRAVAAASSARRSISIAIASPKGGCGKTTLSLNLSMSLARQGRSVILVDADVNSDVLGSIDARDRAKHGVFDVLAGRADAKAALLSTVYPSFRILPAMGPHLPASVVDGAEQSVAWAGLIRTLGQSCDVVVVDTPAGMFSTTRQVLSACTHVVGVLQSEVVAQRSFERFMQGIESLPEKQRPEVLGVFINMLQTSDSSSVSVLEHACRALPRQWLFETAIPRSSAFHDAAHAGLPLRLMDEERPPPVTWLFENLASEVANRLELPAPPRKSRSLLQ